MKAKAKKDSEKAADKQPQEPPPEAAEGGGEAPEAEAAEAAEAAADGQVEEDPVRLLENDLQKWRDLALRTTADLDNYRKRMARDREDAVRFANQSMLEELLPVLDNFEMGMSAAAEEQGSMLYIGLDMVRKQFSDWLDGHGVSRVEVSIGDEFDPSLHEAMAQEASDEVEQGRILRVTRIGFRMHDRLLRPATVVVSSGPEQEGEASEG